MTVLVLLLFRFIRLLGSGHEALAVENAALRLQLLTYQRKRIRPKLTTFDRLFWCTLSRLWRPWRTVLLVVQPDTVARWHASASGSSGRVCQTQGDRPRQTHRCSRDTTLEPQNGDSESALASTSHSRRTQDARNQGVGTNCVTHSSLDSTTAIAKLEDILSKPRAGDRGH